MGNFVGIVMEAIGSFDPDFAVHLAGGAFIYFSVETLVMLVRRFM